MYIKVVEAEYINSLDNAYEKGLKEGKDFNKDDQNLNYRMGYNDGWHDCEASFELGNEFTDSIQEQAYDEGYDSGRNQWQDDYGFTVPDNTVQSLEKEAYAKGLKDKGGINESVKYEEYKKGYEHGVQHMKMQNSIDKYLEMSDKLSLTEDEVDNIIDGAFEEGCAQAYSELQSKTERERALQEKAWDEGYDKAIDDLIEAGVIGESDEDYSDEGYSEYEFGNTEDDEEEYCFSKELDKILNGAFVLDTKTEGSERKHSHYFKDVRHLDYIDVYELNKLFPIDDDTDCILHARKKLLVCGGRGGSKDMITDITDARDTLNRYLQIEGIE